MNPDSIPQCNCHRTHTHRSQKHQLLLFLSFIAKRNFFIVNLPDFYVATGCHITLKPLFSNRVMFSQKFPILLREEGLYEKNVLLGFHEISLWFLVGVFEVNIFNRTCNMLKANSSVSLLMQSGICTSGSIFIAAGCFTPLFLHCQLSFKQQRKCELITFYVHSYTWSPGHFLCNRTFDKLL